MTWPLIAAAIGLPGLAIVLVTLRLRRRFVVVDVHGHSMEPTFHPGDRVLVRRMPLGRIRNGDVVVVEGPGFDTVNLADLAAHAGTAEPAEPVGPALVGPAPRSAAASHDVTSRRWIIKRAVAVPGSPVPDSVAAAVDAGAGTVVPECRFAVLGDNPSRSYDSREHGYYRADQLLGLVIRPMR